MSQPPIDWIDGEPYSRQFGDVYFSRASGLQESLHVFVEGNALPARWQGLGEGSTFVIGETGFGTGLNFLAAWQTWNRVAPRGRLHFISFELHPLSPHQLRLALEPWREVSSLSAALMEQYEDFGPGWHRVAFQDAGVTLTLVIGDVRECLRRMVGKAHAWFLDGFAPARNPQMWEPEMLRALANHSHPGATFATYTSAGAVRRDLQAAGFAVRKLPGYGSKREMSVGQLGAPSEPRPRAERSALIVGAGIAGSATANALACRGWRVTIIDRAAHPSGGASGLPQATMHVRLPRRLLPAHHLALHGYQHSVRLWRQLGAAAGWHPCGTLQLDHASRRIIDAQTLATLSLPPALVRRVTREEASEIAGVPVASGGLYFARGGWLDGAAVCRALITHPNITTVLGCDIATLRHDKDGGWRLGDRQGGERSAPVIVIANSVDAHNLLGASAPPLHAVRGQITLIPCTSYSSPLRTVLCGEGVITPAAAGVHTVGATYRHQWTDASPSLEEQAENLRMLHALNPEIRDALTTDGVSPSGAFVGLRATTPDRTPIAGPWPCVMDGSFFVNLGHGSRGFSTGPLLAELIAAELDGEPLPLPSELLEAVAPDRFAARRTPGSVDAGIDQQGVSGLP